MDNQTNRIKIFSIPHAGGSAYSFMSWSKSLPEEVEWAPLELAGRGRRINEPLYSDFESAINDITNQIIEQSDNTKFGIFGHSMGSLIAFEVAKKLENEHNKVPDILFLSSHNPPVFRRRFSIANLPDNDFIRKISEFGGLPTILLENEELMDILLPIFRSDFKMLEEWKEQNSLKNVRKVSSKLFVITSDSDILVDTEKIQLWNDYSSNDCNFFNVPGGHFYFQKNFENVVNIFKKALSSLQLGY